MAALALTPPRLHSGESLSFPSYFHSDHPLSWEVPSSAAHEGRLHYKGLSSGLLGKR